MESKKLSGQLQVLSLGISSDLLHYLFLIKKKQKQNQGVHHVDFNVERFPFWQEDKHIPKIQYLMATCDRISKSGLVLHGEVQNHTSF